jgi:DNA-directed RNA polymerase subunit RPC12/RpoP
MGALAMHEKSHHSTPKKFRSKWSRRTSYPLRFKAAVVAAVDELLTPKCSNCYTKMTPELEMISAEQKKPEEPHKCPGCGHGEFVRGAKFQ